MCLACSPINVRRAEGLVPTALPYKKTHTSFEFAVRKQSLMHKSPHETCHRELYQAGKGNKRISKHLDVHVSTTRHLGKFSTVATLFA